MKSLIYRRIVQAFSTLDVAASMNGVEDIVSDGGARSLTILFSSLPQLNQTVILFLLDHLVRYVCLPFNCILSLSCDNTYLLSIFQCQQ